jgi:hypothetical protein
MPEFQGRVTRYERLRQQLARARNPSDDFDGWADPVRLTLHFQLKAFIEFAEADPEIKVPEMHGLLFALLDLEDGVRTPLLAPRPLRNKPPPPLLDASFHGRYAALMNWLTKPPMKMKKKEAAEFVVTHGNLRRLLERAKAAAPWRVVSNWRDRINGGVADQRERDGFDEMLKLIEQEKTKHPELDPESLAKKLLRGVTRYYRSQKIYLSPG